MLGHSLNSRLGAKRQAFQSRPSRIAPRVVCSATAVESPLLKNLEYLNPAWSKVQNEKQFFEMLEGEMAAGRCPKQILPVWQDFFNNYRTAITTSGAPGADEKLAAVVQATIADCVLRQFAQPYTFPSLHQRLLEPYNYYEFGQRYVASLIDFDNSVLGHPDKWAHIQQLLDQGHNVVLLANHQTEADPGVFAHMLAHAFPKMATDVVYVAGDRVVTDPLSKPFSMGRNLFCVHSKKHLDDVPELKAQKMETNRKTLVAMQRAMNQGGSLIWIAPSGGRDRPKGPDDEYLPDPFDPSAVELMRNLSMRAKQPTHLFPMAMYSWPMMPPPKTVDKKIGERRITNYTPVGISVGDELNVQDILAGINVDDKEEQQKVLATIACEASTKEFQGLTAAIRDPSKRGSDYVQPWRKA